MVLKGFFWNKREAFPSQVTLARRSGHSFKIVRQAISELEDKAILIVTRRGRRNLYALTDKGWELLKGVESRPAIDTPRVSIA